MDADDLLSGLLDQFSKVSITSMEQLVGTFASILQINQDEASFYLAAADNNLEQAINLYLDNNRDRFTSREAPAFSAYLGASVRQFGRSGQAITAAEAEMLAGAAAASMADADDEDDDVDDDGDEEEADENDLETVLATQLSHAANDAEVQEIYRQYNAAIAGRTPVKSTATAAPETTTLSAPASTTAPAASFPSFPGQQQQQQPGPVPGMFSFAPPSSSHGSASGGGGAGDMET